MINLDELSSKDRKVFIEFTKVLKKGQEIYYSNYDLSKKVLDVSFKINETIQLILIEYRGELDGMDWGSIDYEDQIHKLYILHGKYIDKYTQFIFEQILSDDAEGRLKFFVEYAAIYRTLFENERDNRKFRLTEI